MKYTNNNYRMSIYISRKCVYFSDTLYYILALWGVSLLVESIDTDMDISVMNYGVGQYDSAYMHVFKYPLNFKYHDIFVGK